MEFTSFSKSFTKAKELLNLIKTRESIKQQSVRLTKEVFVKRYHTKIFDDKLTIKKKSRRQFPLPPSPLTRPPPSKVEPMETYEDNDNFEFYPKKDCNYIMVSELFRAAIGLFYFIDFFLFFFYQSQFLKKTAFGRNTILIL